VLEAMGRTITHLGPIGSGQVVKAVNQVILCGTYLGVAEGIVLAIKAGMDPETSGHRTLRAGRRVPGSFRTEASG
jgi:3-hydroxyisobutyrate dehydrogenase-like beta-hydroxyacid dehydrogenase